MIDRKLKILIVEDNPADARFVRLLLTEGGREAQFDLQQTDRLSTALESINGSQPDVILLDLSLPDSKGMDTVIQMLKRAPGTPIIILTGLDDEVLAIQSIHQGAQDYLSKNRLDEHLLTRTIWHAIERKQGEERLRQSEERYRLLFDNNPLPMWVYDIQNYRFLSVNQAAIDHYGYSRDEFMAMTILDIRPAEELERLSENLLQQRETVQKTGPWKHRQKDGTLMDVEIISHDFTFQNQPARLVLANDITQRLRAELALQESEARYRAVFENSLDAILMTSPDGPIHYANRSACAMFGRTQDDLRKVGRPGIVDAADPRLPPLLEERRRTGRMRGELTFIRSDGTKFEGEITSEIFRDHTGLEKTSMIIRDITERKRAEEALRDSEIRFRIALKNSPIVVFNQDRELRYTWIYNPHPGFDPELVLGKTDAELLPADDAARLTGIKRRVLETGFMAREETRTTVDGQTFFYDLTVEPLRDLSGNIIGVTCASVDITERKRAEAEREHLLNALEASLNEIYIFAPDTLKFQFVNAGAVRNLGYSREQLKTLTPLDLKPEFTEASFREMIEPLFRREKDKQTFQTVHRRGNGSLYPVDVHLQLIESAGDRVFLAIILDITERKRAELALEESEKHFRLLADNSSDIISRLTLDGNYIYVSPASRSILGYEPEELIGRHSAELMHPEDLENLATRIETIENLAKMRTITARTRHKDGHYVWLEASSHLISDEMRRPIEIHVSARNITQRRQSEEQIQRQLKRLNALRMIDLAISSSFDLHVILDVVLQHVLSQLGADAGVVLLLNHPMQTMQYAASRGLRSRAVEHASVKVGEGLASRAVLERRTIHIQDLKEFGGELVRSLQSAGENFIDYYGTPLIVKGDVKGVLEVFHRSRLNPDPEWLEFLETLAGQAAIAIDNAQLFQDLQRANTELEQRVAIRTEELNQTNIKLQHANRAKDEFLATMSHELRTPLNSILGLSETLLEQRRDPLSNHQQKSLQIIQSSGSHLLELINDILDLSKIEAGKFDFYPQIVEVNILCQASLAFVQEQAMRKSIALTYKEDEAVSKIFADPRRLKQILVNLLTNAVKFTPDNGQVLLQFHGDTEQDRIKFSVIDTGIGIAPEDLEKLFQPFVQVDSRLTREYEGTGLGLALIQKLTDMHGGSIDVASSVGRGSRFTINLPMGQAMIAQQEVLQSDRQPLSSEETIRPNTPAPEPARRGVILLAEDNMANIITISDYLETHGYQIVVAHNGLEALEKAAEFRPNIILMDIQMPALDGLEAIRRLRADPRFASTPIIALTALAMPGDRERCLEAGAHEYMSKPVSLKELVKNINKLLGNEE